MALVNMRQDGSWMAGPILDGHSFAYEFGSWKGLLAVVALDTRTFCSLAIFIYRIFRLAAKRARIFGAYLPRLEALIFSPRITRQTLSDDNLR